MNLGFYSHVDAVLPGDGSARIPSAVGNLIASLAERAEGTATLYLHGGPGRGIEDMTLRPPVVRAVDLGARRSAPARFFRPSVDLEGFNPRLEGVDALIIQGPSPLLPHLVAAARVPVALQIWGDYSGWRAQPQFPAWRNTAIRLWALLYGLRQRRASRGLIAFINDPHLVASVPHARHRAMTFTPVTKAMLDEVDPAPMEWGPEKGLTEPVRLVYGGRIVRDKGLLECVRAVGALHGRGLNVSLELFGWTDRSDPIADELKVTAERLGVGGSVTFHDYVPSGVPLMRAFARCDIFVIPTYWDSLPRAMLEAMAAGLPVVASAVGGIPHHLKDQETALLIQPRDVERLTDAIERLISEPSLRAKIAASGREWSTAHTQDAESDAIVSEIAKLIA